MNKIKMRDVISSNISKVGYDEEGKKMVIQFTNGRTYNYEDVPKHVYLNMLAADSIGGYFAKNIAKANYKFTKNK